MTRKNRFKYHARVFLLLLFAFSLCACKKEEVLTDGQEYVIYEVNKEETKVSERKIITMETEPGELVKLFVDELSRVSDNADTRPAIQTGVTLKNCSFKDETVTLDFATDYNTMSHIGEILSRAAIVRTFTQISEVKFVTILVEGSPLTNRSGVPIGVMTAEQFIDNSGNVINTEEIALLTLYFANEDGDKLVKVNREVVYSSNIALEKLVVEQLIQGAKEEGAFSVMNPNTEIVAVTVRDGVCYVNLDEDFLIPATNASAQVVFYSIVNSLVEITNVNKVQFFVNGEKNLIYQETMSLSEVYTRNLEIVEESE